MPILWKAIQRRNPRDPNAAAKYYAQDVTRSVVDTEALAHQIAARSGMSEGDMLNVLRTLSDVIQEELGDGNSVRLERIGVLSSSLTSEGGAATPEELRRVPKDVGVNFRPATELRTYLENAGETFTGEVTNLPTP
jgi:predicted histone-like DNA-binding protein